MQTQDGFFPGTKKKVVIKNKNNNYMLDANRMKRHTLDMKDFSHIVMTSRYEQDNSASPIPSNKTMLNKKYRDISGHGTDYHTSRGKDYDMHGLPNKVQTSYQRRRGSTGMYGTGTSLGNIVIKGHATDLSDDLLIARFPG